MKAKEIFKKLYDKGGLVFFNESHIETDLNYDKETDTYYFDRSIIGKGVLNINGRKTCNFFDHELTFTSFDDNEEYIVYVYEPVILKNLL